MTLRDELGAGLLLADGAMGTLAASRGLTLSASSALWVASHPETVLAFHREYVESGARLVFTNTFGASRPVLGLVGGEASFEAINTHAVELARTAAGEHAWVAASIGPLAYAFDPLSFREAEARVAFAEQCRILAGAGVDALAIETMYRADEFRVACETAVGAAGGLPVIASFTVDRGLRTPTGETLATMVGIAVASGADVVGVNCCDGPDSALAAVREIARMTALPILAKPNAGLPVRTGTRICYPATDDQMASFAVGAVAAGARIAGGCCGSTPETIRAMRTALERGQI